MLKAIKEKQRAKRRASKTHHPDDISVYKKLKNKLKSSMHEAKLHYLQSLLEKSKCDPHSFHDLWSSVNDIIRRRKPSTNPTNFNASPDSLNSTVAVTDEHRTATEYAPSCDSSASSFHFTPVNFGLTQKLLQHLNVQKSSGADGISSRLLKEVASEVAEPLTKLYNTSL